MTDETNASAPVVERRARAPKAIGTTDVVIRRDGWDAAGERHRAGSVMTVPTEDALAGLNDGRFSLPGKG